MFQKSEISKNADSERWCSDSSSKDLAVNKKQTLHLNGIKHGSDKQNALSEILLIKKGYCQRYLQTLSGYCIVTTRPTSSQH